MKAAVIALDAVAVLLILSTVICGLWIKSQPNVDPGSVNFHGLIALLTTGSVVLALAVSTFAALRPAA